VKEAKKCQWQPRTISHTRRWIFSCLAGDFRRCRRVRMTDGGRRTCAPTPLPPSGRAASPLCCLLLLHGAVDSWRALSDDERGSRLFVCRRSQTRVGLIKEFPGRKLAKRLQGARGVPAANDRPDKETLLLAATLPNWLFSHPNVPFCYTRSISIGRS
jgi:hypothetical protein